MAQVPEELPPRPKSSLRLKPGRIDIWRIIALALVVFTLIFQVVLIYAPHEAINDYGTLDALDPVAFPFIMVGGLLDLYLILIALYVRRRQTKGDIHSPGYIPHPGYLLFLDMAVMGGCFGWGGLITAFMIMGEDALSCVYTFGILFVGLAHLKLMVDDCRYVHHRRQENKAKKYSRDQNVVMSDVRA